MSYEPGGRMKPWDLARSSRNPTSFMPPFHIFRSRVGNRETARRTRKSYEFVPDRLTLHPFSHYCSKQPWSLFLAFFVFLTILDPLLPFLLGRMVAIKLSSVYVPRTHLLASPNFRSESTRGVP